MVRAIVIVALVLRLLLLIAAEESSCLKYVEYLRDVRSSRTEDANVKIPPLAIDGSALHLSVEITVPIVLPVLRRNSFTLQLNQSLADIVATVSGKKGLRYRVDVSSGSGNSTVSDPTLKITDVRFIIPTLKVPEPIANQKCGRSDNITDVNLLDGGVVKTSPGQFPWLVAIFIRRTWFQFRCSGTLVSDTHVITAARCFEGSGEWLLMSRFRVSVGHYRLRDWEEADAQNRYIRDFTAHPLYEFGKKNYGVNLAVVTLSERVEFTPFVQPICRWSSTSNTNRTTNLSGYVVGWGKEEFDNSNMGSVPRMTKYPLVQKEICLENKIVYLTRDNSRIFCVKKQGSNVLCNIDEGSGLFVQDLVTGQFHLRGILSKLLYDHSVLNCYTARYAIYVDLARHSKWLEEQLAQRPIRIGASGS